MESKQIRAWCYEALSGGITVATGVLAVGGTLGRGGITSDLFLEVIKKVL